MKPAHLFITALLSLTPSVTALAPVTANDPARNADEYLTALTVQEKFNGCVLLESQGKVILRNAYTIGKKDVPSLRVAPDYQFDIHSVSKLMAAALLVKLEADHRLSRTDPVAKYLPDFPNGQQITIRHLLEHRSGLPRELTGFTGKKLALTQAQIIDLIRKEKLEFEPGTNTRYSNLGYEVVYAIIAQVSGKPFAQTVADDIFRPAGMKASGTHFFGPQRLKQLARNHQLQEGRIVAVPNVQDDEFTTARLYSTLDDLQRFLHFVGKGPYKQGLQDTSGVVQKNGGADGIRTQVYTNTRRGYSFVLLANYDEIPFQQIVTDLVAILEGRPYEVPKAVNRQAVALPATVLARYAGKYQFAEANHTELEFKLENGQLVLYQGAEKLATLFAENDSTFFENPKEKDSYAFRKKAAGWPTVLWDYKGLRLTGVRQ